MIADRFGLNSDSLVVELASNDGYLLQHFVARGIPALGIEPAANVAEAAAERGVETLVEFFDAALARALVDEGRRADLIVANNVLAQVPALNDFVAGIEILLAPDGVATIEFPHVVRLIEGLQFDTIYHEHYSYFSLTTLVRLFVDARARGLRRRGAPVPRRLAPGLPAAHRNGPQPVGERRARARRARAGRLRTSSTATATSAPAWSR